jgi:N-acetylglucosamine kinase-like BadF-type ATPase
MPVAIGIDSGGTAIRGRSDERAYTLREPGNARSAGIDATAERILRVIKALTVPERVDAVFVGAAGAGDPAIANALTIALRAVLPATSVVGVGDDVRIALRAALDGDGAALVAGTGSIAYAEVAGQRYRCGGYGHVLGDEGSGFAIGAAALRLTLRALDGRAPRDELGTEIERAIGSAPYSILALDAGGIAGVAPLVLRCDEQGVRSAGEIVENAAVELCALVKGVLGTIRAEHPDLDERDLPLALCGGLLIHPNTLVDRLKARLRLELPSLPIVEGADPALGALKTARASLSLRGVARS